MSHIPILVFVTFCVVAVSETLGYKAGILLICSFLPEVYAHVKPASIISLIYVLRVYCLAVFVISRGGFGRVYNHC